LEQHWDRVPERLASMLLDGLLPADAQRSHDC